VIRQIINFLVLLALAALFWAANYEYGNYYFHLGFLTFLAIAIVYLFSKIIFQELVRRQIKEARSQYTLQRILSIVFYVAIGLAIIGIWVPNTQTLLVSYGLVAAGIAVALQDIFKNFAGGILLFAMGIYRVGDRIEINGRYGDVIDIGIMYTTLLEIKEWVEGDQPTGRIDIIPNSIVLNNTVENYTKQLSFVFEDMSIPVTYKSNWRKASRNILEIVRKETDPVIELASGQMKALGEKYYVQRKGVEPAVFLTVTDNWINMSVRYPTVAKERRATKNRISTAILEMIEASDDIEVASATMEIVGFPPVKLNRDVPGQMTADEDRQGS
jgi:small-conductance mechanosensitive channel